MTQEVEISTIMLLTAFAMLFAGVAVNGFFVLAEYSLVSIRQSRVQELVEDGDSRAMLVQKLHDRLEKTLNCTQFGSTVAAMALAWFGQDMTQQAVAYMLSGFGHFRLAIPPSVTSGIAFALIMYLQMLFGEQMPKVISVSMAEPIALSIARPLRLYCLIVEPLTWVIGKSIAALKLLLPFTKQTHNKAVSIDELDILVREAEEAGRVSEEDADVLGGALDFCDEQYSVERAMVRIEHAHGVHVNASLREIILKLRKSEHHKLVVYHGKKSNVVGVLQIEDLWDLLENVASPGNVVHKIGFKAGTRMVKPHRVHCKVKASEVLHEMRERRIKIALVTNERGATIGVITIDDLMKTIVGHNDDQQEEPKQRISLSKAQPA